MVLFFKINNWIDSETNDKQPSNLAEFNKKYEIVWGILSFVSKLPLQLFFFLGAFQRERYAPVETELGDNLEDTRSEFNATVIEAAIFPALVAVVLGLLCLAVFKSELGLDPSKFFLGVFFFLLAVAGFGIAVFLPTIIQMGEDVKPIEGVALNYLSSILAVLACAVAQALFDWFNPGPNPGGRS